jgi:glycosyltransferase involved in cell wall biosynthesis
MSSHKPLNILFIYTNLSSFVKADFEILSSVYKVDKFRFDAKPGVLSVGLQLIKQFLFLLTKIWKYDTIYIWFADYHSLLPIIFSKLLNKKSLIVNGGYDIARIKQYNYGVFCSPIRGFFAIQSIRNCSINLPVSKFIERKVRYLAPETDCKLIYNCMNLKSAIPENFNKGNIVLTVAIVDSERTFYLKGIDIFIEIARQLHLYQFIIVGLSRTKVAHLLGTIPNNLLIVDKIPHEELIAFYQKARIYCQLSITESFGVALAEAMFQNCYPIVTNQGALPEVVGNFGLILRNDPNEIANAILKFFKNIPDSRPVLIRDYIMSHFSPEIRKQKLISLLKKLQTIS